MLCQPVNKNGYMIFYFTFHLFLFVSLSGPFFFNEKEAYDFTKCSPVHQSCGTIKKKYHVGPVLPIMMIYLLERSMFVFVPIKNHLD